VDPTHTDVALRPDRVRALADEVRDRGVSSPVQVMSPQRARRLSRLLRVSGASGVWDKDRAVSSAAYYRVATDPTVLALVEEVLGPDVLLWGAALAIRKPGQPHRWHSDRETATTSGTTPTTDGARSVAVWIPLRNGGPDSSLVVVPGSHRFGQPVQQVVSETGLPADGADDERVAQWAAERGGDAFARPAAGDGEAVIFDSRLWHSTVNGTPRTRVALLLQYATPETEIRVPPTGNFSWPFTPSDERPPCILVAGSDRAGVNDIVDPPAEGGRADGRLRPAVHHMPLPLSDGEGWTVHRQFNGTTGTGLQMACHASVLEPGMQPHEPHTHPEEEVLVVLDGVLEVHLPGRGEEPEVEHLERGGVVHYPLDQRHTVRALPGGPATYVMLKWCTTRSRSGSGADLGTQVLRDRADGPSEGWTVHRGFKGRTQYLRALECHRSTLEPGAGYRPHADAYDVAIVTLEGTVETIGLRVEANLVIWYPMGSSHGMHNPGGIPASYVVFEFHGANLGSSIGPHRLRTVPHHAAQLARRAVRKAKRTLAGLR
jgi:quercetin dioxygenase-like cupin family protein